ncbi:MAG: SRPBCC family protein [Dehalococcoidia bacterium]|nr:SRPBCC family protein [Dehalococcoidia bacterium]
MGTTKEQITIKAPKGFVFTYLEDISNRERIMSESFGAFRLISPQSKGTGAKVSFGAKALKNAPSELEIGRVQWPRSIEEKGSLGERKFKTIYKFEDTATADTLLTVELEFEEREGLGKFMPGDSTKSIMTSAYQKMLQVLKATLQAHIH